jgi:indole-3-glycerol phosphate synthase
MAVLVESHTREELDRALLLPTPLIGINNRSLHTFNTDLQLSLDLKNYIPEDKIVITESGINTREDIKLMQARGINTFLIGESLMRAENIGAALKKLLIE